MADANVNPQGQQGQTGQQQLQVKVPDDVQKGVYSNAVSVNVNSNEVVLDFGYLLPNTAAPIIEVVSRVNINQRTAESFLGVLSGAMEDFKQKQAQQQAAAGAPQAMGPAPMPAQGVNSIEAAPMGPQSMAPQQIGPQPMGPAPMAPQPMGPAPMAPYPTNA